MADEDVVLVVDRNLSLRSRVTGADDGETQCGLSR
jgi:hypothetical protein